MYQTVESVSRANTRTKVQQGVIVYYDVLHYYLAV